MGTGPTAKIQNSAVVEKARLKYMDWAFKYFHSWHKISTTSGTPPEMIDNNKLTTRKQHILLHPEQVNIWWL